MSPDPDSLPESTPGQRPASAELHVPSRGDLAATPWSLLGLAFYFGFFTLLVVARMQDQGETLGVAFLELVGMGQGRSAAMLVLVILGFGIFLFGAYTVLRDLQSLSGEETDIQWILDHRDAPTLVLMPSASRAERYRAGVRHVELEEGSRVETLMDGRVHRVLEAQRDRRVRLSPEELRVIAEARTSRYGATARFVSGLLLLVAVLGTFAGVKAALPDLIDAVSRQAGSLDLQSIAGPLRAVAAAFGANSLALIGAIAIGLMSHGLATGRRHLLERLELASEPLYRGLQGTASVADPLTAAVETLADVAQRIGQGLDSVGALQGGIDGLAQTFEQSFADLSAGLADLARDQERALQQRMDSELQLLQLRVADMAEALDHNTRCYQGLVEAVGQRADDARRSIEATQSAVHALRDGLAVVGRMESVSTRATVEVSQALEATQAATEVTRQQLEQVSSALFHIRPALEASERYIAGGIERVGVADERIAAAWTQMQSLLTRVSLELDSRDQRLGEALANFAREVAERHERSAATATASVEALGDRLAQVLRAAPRPGAEARSAAVPERSPLLVGALQGAGMLGVATIAYLAYELAGRLLP